MRSKHAEKKESMKNIEKLKKRVQEKSAGNEEIADAEFDKIMSKGGSTTKKVLTQVRTS